MDQTKTEFLVRQAMPSDAGQPRRILNEIITTGATTALETQLTPFAFKNLNPGVPLQNGTATERI